MKRVLVALAALLTLSLGGTASAADLRPAYKAPPPPPPPVYSWTGCYIGAGFGYGMFNQEGAAFNPDGTLEAISRTNGGRGWLGTVQVGCDYQFAGPFGGNWVIGAFADYDWSNIHGDAHFFQRQLGTEKLRSSWAAGGRIGWVALPQLLVYFSGGYTQARFNQIDFVDIGTGLPSNAFFDQHTYKGWFIGTGYEYGLGWFPGLFWKTEYRWSEFRTDRLALLGTGVAPGFTHDSQKFVQAVRSELVWRFNWGGGYGRY